MAISSLALSGCASDETLSGYALTGQPYALVSINGAAVDAGATLILSREEIALNTPCGDWTAALAVPYPWFELSDLRPIPTVATDAICNARAAELEVIDAISTMTIAESSGRTLILSDTDGRSMVFQAD